MRVHLFKMLEQVFHVCSTLRLINIGFDGKVERNWSGIGTSGTKVEQIENVPFHFLNEASIYEGLSGTKLEQAFHT